MIESELTYVIRGAIFAVHNELGPGLLESVYQAALSFELSLKGLKVQSQLKLPALYKGVELPTGFRIDLLVEETIIIEIKSIEILLDVHKKQLLTYLRLSKKHIGFLVNFNSASLIDKQSLIRIIN